MKSRDESLTGEYDDRCSDKDEAVDIDPENSADRRSDTAPDAGSKENDPDSERVFRMWEPLSFNVEPGYDYLNDGLLSRAFSIAFRAFAYLVLQVVDRVFFGFHAHGVENILKVGGSGAVCVCNHVHPMDCTMVNLVLPFRRIYYPTLEANFRIPVIRHIVHTLGGVPLSSEPHCQAEMFGAMGQALNRGNFVQIYPEGVLYPYYPDLRKMRDGAFYLAVKSNVPIIPMVITYHEPHGIMRLYKTKPCLHLRVLAPVYPLVGTTRREAVNDLRDNVTDSMKYAINEAFEYGNNDSFDEEI